MGAVAISSSRRKAVIIAALVGLTLVLAACGSSTGSTASPGKASNTVTYAEPANSPPNYIFPFLPGAYLSVVNGQLQGMLYRKLYYFGDNGGSVGINEQLSLAQLPSWSADGKTATITLKSYKWSNGETVTADDVLFWINMDMVEKAGFDESFADKWPTFLEAITKMTKKGKTYGFGIGIQIGGYGEWYQRLRAAGGSYLTPDLKHVNVNHPAVVEATQQFADLFKKGIAPPLGTYTYDNAPAAFAAGKMAIYSSDLATTTTLPKKVPFKWKLLPYPPGPVSRVNFNDLTLYMVNPKSSNQDLMWEVLKWWTTGQNDAYWAGHSGTYPARSDAPHYGYSKWAAPQMGEAFASFQKYAVGLENFPAWANVENAAEAEIQNCYAGKESAKQAVENVAKIVQQQTGASL